MKLTEHFTLDELIFSSTADRRGIDNSPSLEIVAHLTTLASGLEQIRALIDAPIRVDSGYRCARLNAAIGGARTSAHLQGYAADFTAAGYGTPQQIARAIAGSDIRFDQCIEEGTWVHISFAPTLRRELLTAHFSAAGTTYSKGV